MKRWPTDPVQPRTPVVVLGMFNGDGGVNCASSSQIGRLGGLRAYRSSWWEILKSY